jgi:peptidase A4-like protein
MTNTNGKTQFYQPSSSGTFARASRRLSLSLSLAALLLGGVAISTSAQEAGSYKIAAEKGFTVVPHAQTPIVVKTMPDAACDLHVAGAGESSNKLRFYANGDGYVKIHANAKQESEDGVHVQLDCQANGQAMSYPIHVRASSSATAEMPAPPTVMPTPKSSQVKPALSAQEAEQLSDEELIGRGFPPRPDAATAPDAYAQWLDLISQPITIVPPHLVSRTDIAHSSKKGNSQQQGVQNSFATDANWSGYVDATGYRGFTAVYGQWNVPSIVACESNTTTYSSFWVGLDGYESGDLVQDGTEADCTDILGIFNFTGYSAWEELLPNQPYSQNVSLSPNAGDSFWALAWVGDANHQYDPNGAYAWFNMWDLTQRQGVLVGQALNGTWFYGYTAEWIMERPTVSGQFAQLSDYNFAVMGYPEVLTSSFNWNYYSSFSNNEMWMYNYYYSGNDNNLLSAAAGDGPTAIYYYWFNYH